MGCGGTKENTPAMLPPSSDLVQKMAIPSAQGTPPQSAMPSAPPPPPVFVDMGQKTGAERMVETMAVGQAVGHLMHDQFGHGHGGYGHGGYGHGGYGHGHGGYGHGHGGYGYGHGGFGQGHGSYGQGGFF